MAGSPAFARKSALSKWAAGSPEDDLHVERGRPKFAQRADNDAKLAVETDYKLSKHQKTEALAKFKIGTRVVAKEGHVVKVGTKGMITDVEQTGAGAFRYSIKWDGGMGTGKMLEQSLGRA